MYCAECEKLPREKRVRHTEQRKSRMQQCQIYETKISNACVKEYNRKMGNFVVCKMNNIKGNKMFFFLLGQQKKKEYIRK